MSTGRCKDCKHFMPDETSRSKARGDQLLAGWCQRVWCDQAEWYEIGYADHNRIILKDGDCRVAIDFGCVHWEDD